MRLLVLVTFLATSCLSVILAIEITPATVTDSFGNYADQDSNIVFAEVPAGDPYVVDPTTYSYKGLLPLFNGVHGFVNMCFFGPLPYDLFLNILSGSIAFGSDLILTLFKWGGGYALSVVIGLLFVGIFPIVACCFCCCRTCCGNCGGKMVQKRTDSTPAWRCCLIITLFLSCTLLGCGMICTYVVNERMTTLFSDVATTVNENVEDFSRYTNNTINQINYVAYDGFNFTAKVMLRDLDNIGPLVGGAVQESMDKKAGIDDAFDQLLAMDPLLEGLIDGLNDVETKKAAVAISVANLETSMTAVATDIDNTYASCGSTCDPAPDTSQLKAGSNFDPANMPSFSSELADLEAVYAENITALVLDGKREFNNISGTVEQESAPVVDTIRTMVGTFDGIISDALKSVDDMLKLFDAVSNLTDIVSDLETTPIAAGMTIGDLENYRWMGGVGLTCFVLLILVLQLVGLIMGCCACCCCGDKDAIPTQRGTMGNCAGILLMASVGLVFIFGALIMLLVWLTFLVGAPLEKLVCNDLRKSDYSLFTELIDGGDPASGPYPTLLGSQDGYTLGNMAFQDATIPITVAGLLTDCANDEPAWKALYIGKFFDINAVLDYKGTIDIDGEIDKISVDLSTLEMIDANTKKQLQDMSTAISGIDFDGLIAELEKTTVTADFDALRAALNNAANAANTGGQTGIENDLRAHIVELDRIESQDVAAVSDAQSDMLASVKSLKASSAGVPTQINTLILTLETTEAELQANGELIIKNESKIFALRVLNVGDQFVTFVNHTIQGELGRCKPVSNFWESVLVNTLCGSIVDSWNGVWFSLGWSLAFMVFGIIFSTKLAKHVRKMKELHPDDSGTDPIGRGGKVHPI